MLAITTSNGNPLSFWQCQFNIRKSSYFVKKLSATKLLH